MAFSRNMHHVFSVLFVIIASWLLSACTCVETSPCNDTAWYRIGYRDGERGFPATRISFHRQTCYPHNILPDAQLYEQGRLKGLLAYCTPENAFTLGTRGEGYSGQCPKDLESAFLDALKTWRNLYYLEISRKNEELELSVLRAELLSLEQELATRENKFIQAGISHGDQQESITDDLELLVDRKKILLVNMQELEASIASIRQDLKVLRETFENQ